MSEDQYKYTSDVSAINYREVEPLLTTRSFNNRFILAPYEEERTLRAKENSGFAMLAQKTNIVPLKVLADTKLTDGTFVPKGSTAYVKEQLLFTQTWAKQVLESDAVGGKFIIVDLQFVELVVPA
jgi:hypothetical protein